MSLNLLDQNYRKVWLNGNVESLIVNNLNPSEAVFTDSNKKLISGSLPSGPTGSSGFTGPTGPTGSSGPTGSIQDIGVALTQATGQSIPNLSSTALIWDTVVYDTASFFDALTPDRITIPSDGKYIIGGNIIWNIGATGFFDLYTFRTNDSLVLNQQNVSQGDSALGGTGQITNDLCSIRQFSAGDHIQLFVGTFFSPIVDTWDVVAQNGMPSFFCQKIT